MNQFQQKLEEIYNRPFDSANADIETHLLYQLHTLCIRRNYIRNNILMYSGCRKGIETHDSFIYLLFNSVGVIILFIFKLIWVFELIKMLLFIYISIVIFNSFTLLDLYRVVIRFLLLFPLWSLKRLTRLYYYPYLMLRSRHKCFSWAMIKLQVFLTFLVYSISAIEILLANHCLIIFTFKVYALRNEHD